MSLRGTQLDRSRRVLKCIATLVALLSAGCDSAAPPRAEMQAAAPPAQRSVAPGETLPQPEAIANQVAATPSKSVSNDDQERLLWESPTAGVPLKLTYLPPGIQAVVAWRPAQCLDSDLGKTTFENLGRFSQELAEQIESRLGFPLAQVEELLIGLLDGDLTDTGLSLPRMTLVATCRQSIDVSALASKWNSPTAREQPAGKLFEGPQHAWYLPNELNGKCLVVAPVPEMRDILELEGAPPSLRNEMQSLLMESDGDWLFTVIFAPSFLATGGKQLLAGPLAPVVEQMEWFRLDRALAVMLSAHLDDNLFVEARLYTKPDVRAALVERDLQRRLAESPQHLSEYLASGTPTPYGAEVLARFPKMWEQLAANTRTAYQGRQVIVRTVLPGVAAPNLALAGNLALTEILPPAAAVASATEAPLSLTVEERLNRPISLSFPRQTLEQAIELFGREAGIEVEILGGDLQLEGITKNQSFGLETSNLSAGEVLQKILEQASPDGKLIYVIRQDPAQGVARLYVTTKASAAKRGEKVPSNTVPKVQN